jgi:hypothetical protein
MPQRNGQNPTRAVRNFGHNGNAFHDAASTKTNAESGSGVCPSCKAEVPPKPGFRMSALKCQKCGASMGKK